MFDWLKQAAKKTEQKAVSTVKDLFTISPTERATPGYKPSRLELTGDLISKKVPLLANSAITKMDDYFKPKDEKLRVRDVVREVPEAFAEVVGRPQLRAYASVGGLLAGKPLKPEGDFQKGLYGTDQELTLTRAGREMLGQDPDKKTTSAAGKVLFPMLGFLSGSLDAVPGGSAAKAEVKGGVKALEKVGEDAPEIFKGARALTTKILDRLAGRSTVSRQFIEDLTKGPDIKDAERVAIQDALQGEGDKIRVKDFGEKVESNLLPLERSSIEEPQYERINLPEELRYDSEGTPISYEEHIYKSPVETSVGAIHFRGEEAAPNYFAHTRTEDLMEGGAVVGRDLDGKPIREVPNQAREGRFVMRLQAPGEWSVLDRTTNAPVNETALSYKEAEKLAKDTGAKLGNDFDEPAVGGTRRVLEIQSDLFQKGRLERENPSIFKNEADARRSVESGQSWPRGTHIEVDGKTYIIDGHNPTSKVTTLRRVAASGNTYGRLELPDTTPAIQQAFKEYGDELAGTVAKRAKEIARLEPYKNTWHERVIREEVKRAAQDGKSNLQFPTGETAMKIEGLAGNTNLNPDGGRGWFDPLTGDDPFTAQALEVRDLAPGKVLRDVTDEDWLITEVGANGNFKAVPVSKLEEYAGDEIASGKATAKEIYDDLMNPANTDPDGTFEMIRSELNDRSEGFNIGEGDSVDTSNPIYKFYDGPVAKFLKKLGAKPVTDAQGVTWMELPVDQAAGKAPVQAFAAVPGMAAGTETDEQGNITGYDPLKGALGLGIGLGAQKVSPQIYRSLEEATYWLRTHSTNAERIAKTIEELKARGGDAKRIRNLQSDLRYETGAADTAAEEAKLFRGATEGPSGAGTGTETIGDVMARGGGEPPRPPVSRETGPIPGQEGPERRFITRTRALDPELDPKLQGAYERRSTENLVQAADELIQSDRAAAEDLARTGLDDSAVATASRLIETYVTEARAATDEVTKDALYTKAADIANDAARNLTEHGRAVQAASILAKQTPEGMVRWAARQIQNHNAIVAKGKSPIEGTVGRMFGTNGKAMKKVPELTGEQAKRIGDEMERIQGLADDKERAKAFQKLQTEVRGMLPSSLYSKIITFWKAGLLTGLRTTGINIASNLTHNVTEVAKDVPAALVDRMASLFTGKRTLAMTGRGQASGTKEGIKKGWEYLTTGYDERDVADKLDYHQVNFGNGKVGKTMQAYTDAVFRTLGAEDQPFYYGARNRSLMSQAIANAMNEGLKGSARAQRVKELMANPTEEMVKYATLDAQTAVFQNKTALGGVARSIQKAPGGEVIVPFGKTPAAVATQLFNYSPAGIVLEIAKAIVNRKEFDQRLFSQAIGRGLTGTAAMYLGGQLYNQGMLTLSRPKSEKEQDQWQLEGKTGTSILIDGKWRNVGFLGPLGFALIVGGAFQDGVKQTGSFVGGLARAAAGAGAAITQQTFLQGINSLTNALNDPERYAQSFVTNLVGSIVPTIIADVARGTDTVERNSQMPDERLMSRVPGLRELLEPQVDSLGNEVPTPGFFTTLLDPTRPGTATALPEDKPIVDELERLNASQKEAGRDLVTPSLLGTRYGFKSLTPELNTYMWKLAGAYSKAQIKAAITDPSYATYDDEAKAKLIGKMLEDASTQARARTVNAALTGLPPEEQQAQLAAMKDDGLLTKSVYYLAEALRSDVQ